MRFVGFRQSPETQRDRFLLRCRTKKNSHRRIVRYWSNSGHRQLFPSPHRLVVRPISRRKDRLAVVFPKSDCFDQAVRAKRERAKHDDFAP
jgi:hypothetical protein